MDWPQKGWIASGPLGRVGQGFGIAAHDVWAKDVSHIGPLALLPCLKVAPGVLVCLLLTGRRALDGGEPAGPDGVPPLRRLARCALLRLQPQLLVVGLRRPGSLLKSQQGWMPHAMLILAVPLSPWL